LILAAILSYFFLVKNTEETDSPAMIYAEFYDKYEPSLQGRGSIEDDAILLFNEAYSEEKFQVALDAIKPYLKEGKNDIKLSAAIAAIETDDLVLAEGLLDEIIASKDFYFSDHASWYKALLQLKTGETKSIEKILTPLIANPKADHHDEAKKLLAKIEG